MTAPTLTLSETSKWYGDVLAVNDVTAEVGAGVTGLLGPNGAGKSTLLKMVTGMLRPSLGEVRLLGVDPFDNPAIMRRVGLCPEQDALYPGAKAFDTIAYLTRLHGFSRPEAASRAERALDRVGLSNVMDRPIDTFSKGMRQRAKLAQAIAHDPDMIVLDEPLNGLDPVARREMTALIRSFGDEGRCVLVSSHVLHEIEAMTHRVLLLSHGMVVAEGTIEQIRRDLSDRPLAVRIDTPDPKGLASRILTMEGIRRIDLEPARLDVMTTRPTDLFRELARLSSLDGVAVTRYGALDESLEAVFRYLTT